MKWKYQNSVFFSLGSLLLDEQQLVKPDPFNSYALLCCEQRSLQLEAGAHKA